MTEKFIVTMELTFDEEDFDLHVSTKADNIHTTQSIAIAMFFKQAIAKQAEVCAGLAVEYAEVVKVLENARNNDWEE